MHLAIVGAGQQDDGDAHDVVHLQLCRIRRIRLCTGTLLPFSNAPVMAGDHLHSVQDPRECCSALVNVSSKGGRAGSPGDADMQPRHSVCGKLPPIRTGQTRVAHLENKSVLPWVYRSDEHAIEHLIVLLALRGADVDELPL